MVESCRYCQWKNLLTWTKDKKRKTEIGGERRNVVWSMRDLDDKGLGQNKVLCSFSGVELPIVNYHASSLTLPAPGRQISDYLPASGSRTALTRIPPCRLFLVASSLSLHLVRFLARHVGCPRFCFARSWIVGLAMGRAESRGAGADSFYLIHLIVARLKL